MESFEIKYSKNKYFLAWFISASQFIGKYWSVSFCTKKYYYSDNHSMHTMEQAINQFFNIMQCINIMNYIHTCKCTNYFHFHYSFCVVNFLYVSCVGACYILFWRIIILANVSKSTCWENKWYGNEDMRRIGKCAWQIHTGGIGIHKGGLLGILIRHNRA